MVAERPELNWSLDSTGCGAAEVPAAVISLLVATPSRPMRPLCTTTPFLGASGKLAQRVPGILLPKGTHREKNKKTKNTSPDNWAVRFQTPC